MMTSGVREHRLSNGMLVLLKEHHGAPVISFSVVYRVGSKCDPPGRSGLSHLLEHEMFQGTPRHPRGDHDRLLTLAGADTNAYTWMDQSVYYALIAADKISLVLELEADRMRNLVLDPREHAEELAVVRNEQAQREDSPLSVLHEYVQAVAFAAHPYAKPTLGWLGDFERLSLQQVREHYERFYQPANAFIVVVGDFAVEPMAAALEEHFGPIAAGDYAALRLPTEPPQLGPRRLTVRRAANTDYLLIAWRIPGSTHADAPALELAAHILGQGRTSRLYRSLVDTGKATAAYCYSGCFSAAQPYLLFAGAALNAGTRPEEAEVLIQQEVSRLASGGVTVQELSRAKKQARASFIYSRDCAESEASLLIAFELASSYRNLDRYLHSIEAVTAEEVQRVAATYLTRENSTTGHYLGARDTAAGRAAGSTAPPAGLATGGAAPRLVPPRACFRAGGAGRHPSSRLEPCSLLAGERVRLETLPNGVQVLLGESRANPTVAVAGRIRCGSVFETPQTQGLANFTVRMLTEGTQLHSKQELAAILEDNAVSLSFIPGREHTDFAGRCLAEDLPVLLQVLAEELSQPGFPREGMERIRKQILSDLAREADSAIDRAYNRGRALLYGAESPYGWPVLGTEESVKSFTPEHLEAFYRHRISPAQILIALVGDFAGEEALALLAEHLGSRETETPDDSAVYASAERILLHGRISEQLPLADRSSTTILLMRQGVKRLSPDYHPALVANYLFGGDFSSRLNQRLREQEALTYGSYSFLGAGKGCGPWVVYVQVNPGQALRAVEIVLEQWRQVAEEGFSPEELDKAKSFLTSNFAVRLSTKEAVAFGLVDAVDAGLELDYLERYCELINGLKLGEVNAAFASRFAPEDYALIIAGNVDGL